MLTKFSKADKQEYSKFYKKEGYVVFTDLFAADELKDIVEDLLKVFEKRFSGVSEKKGIELLYSEYSRNREAWRDCASKMWDVFGVLQCATKREVKNVLVDLGIRSPIIATRPEVRTDMPNDVNYQQPWHQDWIYGQTSLNAVTLWIPLQDVSKENGTIDIIPKSHLLGLAPVQEKANPRRLEINDPVFTSGEYKTVELKLGECVIFSQFLIHRSGNNVSELPRLTFQGRFADYSDELYVANGFFDSFRAQAAGKELRTNPTIEQINRYFTV
jgi:phytanoyl-CoA hydroxylase